MQVAVAAERRWGISSTWVRRLLRSAAGQLGSRLPAGELSVLLAGRATTARLNRRYRGKAGPTNILTFPFSEVRGGMLGEIILCVPVVRAEAPRFGRTTREHAGLLLLHGLLHLAGYDHRRPTDRRRMEATERRLWNRWRTVTTP